MKLAKELLINAVIVIAAFYLLLLFPGKIENFILLLMHTFSPGT